MSVIAANYTSLGCLKKGAAGISQKDAFVAAAGAHRFNEVYVPPHLSRPGWYQNERGIYVGYGRDEDLQSFRVSENAVQDYAVVEGFRGAPAFCPQSVYNADEEYTRKFSVWIDAAGVFVGNRLHLRVVVKNPSHSERLVEDNYTDTIRFVFAVSDATHINTNINLYSMGDMGFVAAMALNQSVQRQSGLTFLDGAWHTYDLILYKNASSSLFIDGIYSYSSSEGSWDGKLINPNIQIFAESRPDSFYAVQACSLEVYDAV